MKTKVLKFFLMLIATVFISGATSRVEAGSPIGVHCWSLSDATGLVSTLELAVNDDAPPARTHLSAVGVWARLQGEACVPVHGTIQQNRLTKENYELALSYEDILDISFLQGHFHARFDLVTLSGSYAYEDENSGINVIGTMAPTSCPIRCP